jgi:hypothetical protein
MKESEMNIHDDRYEQRQRLDNLAFDNVTNVMLDHIDTDPTHAACSFLLLYNLRQYQLCVQARYMYMSNQ